MPGVPSVRACEACRKQKKKCDEAIPACSRCRRLCIPCIGSGERRFTFKTQNHRFEVSSGQRKLRTLQPLYPSPTNEQGRLEKAFLSKVMISDDLQYSLSWAYGSFLVEVPLRLGTNNALDAAARALVSVHTCFSSPSRTMSVQALSQYTQAITALRNSLDNPAQAYSSSTLCAVNILLIAQGLISMPTTKTISHCHGAAAILKAKGVNFNPDDPFEGSIFYSLGTPILFEGLFNRKIQFTRQEWARLINNEFAEAHGTGPMMDCLAAIPDIVARGRSAFNDSRFDEIGELRTEAQDMYNSLLILLEGVRSYYEADARYPSPFQGVSDDVHSLRMKAHWQRVYGLTLAIALFYNCMLDALVIVPKQRNPLDADAAKLVIQVINIAEDAKEFRPLGSSYIVLCLVAAWSRAIGSKTRVHIEVLLEEYLSDFPPRIEHTTFDLGLVARYFNLREDDPIEISSVSSGGYRIC